MGLRRILGACCALALWATAAVAQMPSPALLKLEPEAWLQHEGERLALGGTPRSADLASVRLVPYGEVPTLECGVLRYCILELRPGESFRFLTVGDQARFEVIGEEYGLAPVVLIRPLECDVSTEVVAATDRRIYKAYIESPPCRAGDLDPRGPSTHARVFVPGELVQRFEQRRARAAPPAVASPSTEAKPAPRTPSTKAATERIGHINLGKVERNHRWQRKWGVRFSPIDVFDDGERLYIRLEDNGAPVPVVWEVVDGELALANYQFLNGYLVTDRVLDEAVLGVGDGKGKGRRKRIRVWREGGP